MNWNLIAWIYIDAMLLVGTYTVVTKSGMWLAARVVPWLLARHDRRREDQS